MNTASIIFTEEGYKKLEEQLRYLKGTKKMEIAERIKIAREFGDISENSEYDEAKNEQGQLETKIMEIEEALRLAKVVTKPSTKEVGVGVSVTLYDHQYKEEITYHIVGVNEVDVSLCKISIESSLGKALVGKKKGEHVDVKLESGTSKYKILDIKVTKVKECTPRKEG